MAAYVHIQYGAASVWSVLSRSNPTNGESSPERYFTSHVEIVVDYGCVRAYSIRCSYVRILPPVQMQYVVVVKIDGSVWPWERHGCFACFWVILTIESNKWRIVSRALRYVTRWNSLIAVASNDGNFAATVAFSSRRENTDEKRGFEKMNEG